MKNILILIFIFLIFFLSFYLRKKTLFIEYKIENKVYKLLKAETSLEWEKGLMFYKNKKELKGADGMIFIFPDKKIRNFWNKNTYLDLEVYWIDDEKIVGKDYLPNIIKSKEIITINSKVMVNKVVELVK